MQHTGSSLKTEDDKTSSAIVVDNLWKSYGDAHILKGLTLSVPRGKTLVILGRSGVGKSVLLRQILGIEKPDLGTIDVHGIRITELSRDELFPYLSQFGMLFQSSALFDSMTIGDNVAFYLREHSPPVPEGKTTPEEDILRLIKEALAKVGLEGYEQKMPSELSGGQKRRAALARLIIYKPKVLLYDEPTTGLDPVTAMHINELIMQTQQELEATSIVVTHDMQSALKIGDYFALHHEGKIAFFADKEQFLETQHPLISEFFRNAVLPLEYTRKMKDVYSGDRIC